MGEGELLGLRCPRSIFPPAVSSWSVVHGAPILRSSGSHFEDVWHWPLRDERGELVRNRGHEEPRRCCVNRVADNSSSQWFGLSHSQFVWAVVWRVTVAAVIGAVVYVATS